MASLVDVPLRVDWVVVDGRVLRGVPVEHELAVVHLAHAPLPLARTEVPGHKNSGHSYLVVSFMNHDVMLRFTRLRRFIPLNSCTGCGTSSVARFA